MNEFDIFKSIAENLSDRKSSAALSNYDVLCNNIDYVNKTFRFGLLQLSKVEQAIAEALEKETMLSTEFLDSTKPFFFFRSIIPRLLSNGTNVCQKFLINTMPEDRRNITMETVDKLRRSFIDYNDLVTAARQYIDSLVTDAYQLVLLEPKSLNYHVLVSLNSFNKYATRSIRQGLFNEALENALAEFEKLTFKQWCNSSITKCEHDTFAKKVGFLFQELNISSQVDLNEEIKNLFKFSSEFAHIGFVSTFFTSSYDNEVIFADNKGRPYLPSTENFSELKYQLLETAMKFFYTVYLPSIIHCCKRVFTANSYQDFELNLGSIAEGIKNRIQSRNNQYYFFIVHGLIDSNATIPLKCRCGATRYWEAPHDLGELFCEGCGSVFHLLEVERGSGYIITSAGPAKPIGSDLPDFGNLPIEKQEELLKQCEVINSKSPQT